jgi:hypothetical protein
MLKICIKRVYSDRGSDRIFPLWILLYMKKKLLIEETANLIIYFIAMLNIPYTFRN